MILLSYNLSENLHKSFIRLNDLKTKFLLLEIAPQEERRLRFETECTRLYWLLNFMGEKVTKTQIVTALSRAGKKGESGVSKRICTTKYFMSAISYEWTLNPRSVSPLTVLEIVEHFDKSVRRDISLPSLKTLFQYIEKGRDPALISAILILQGLLTSPQFKGSLFAVGVFTASLILCQGGFDYRRLVVFEDFIAGTREELESIFATCVKMGNLTVFMERFAKGYLGQIEKDYDRIKNKARVTQMPQKFFHLSERQKEIIALMEKPSMTLTNRQVQKEFGISQITASRDLSRLATLGILYPYGKGRSIYYTKI